jgi:cytochrome c oxidase subunit III
MTSAVLDQRAPDAGPPAAPPYHQADGEPGGGGGIFGDPARFGMLAFMGTISMLFIGFTSAYILRAASADWRPLSPPAVLWVSTLALGCSSLALESARRGLRTFDVRLVQNGVMATGLLGTLFLIGQVLGWRALAAQGVFLATNPHSSFFYLLTGLHGLHLIGGLIWLVPVTIRAHRMEYAPGTDALGLVALYWHFLGALWLYLGYLLFFF